MTASLHTIMHNRCPTGNGATSLLRWQEAGCTLPTMCLSTAVMPEMSVEGFCTEMCPEYQLQSRTAHANENSLEVIDPLGQGRTIEHLATKKFERNVRNPTPRLPCFLPLDSHSCALSCTRSQQLLVSAVLLLIAVHHSAHFGAMLFTISTQCYSSLPCNAVHLYHAVV